MTRMTLAALFAAAALGIAIQAPASDYTPLPADRAEAITGKLAARGYETLHLKSDHRGRKVEALARRDGRLWEIELDAASLRILEIEAEDGE